MAYNKFIKKDGTVMLDLTDTTVSAETLAKDITAVDKSGNKITGTLIIPEGTLDITENGEVDVTNYASANVNVPIPDGYIIPEGTIEITNTDEVDVTNYATAKVVDSNLIAENIAKDITILGITGTLTDSPIPIEVSTEEEMATLLESGEVGSVYKYTGETGTYENEALYELTEETDQLNGEVTKSFTKLILQSDLEEITITENGEYNGEYSKVTVDVESGGSTEFNIAYGDTEPTDTSKLWVKASEPNEVQVTTKPVYVFDDLQTGIASLPTGASYMGVASIGSNVYLFGGLGSSYLNTINVFNTETNTITSLSTTLPTAAYGIGVASVGTNIYLFGGTDSSINKLNTINVFNTETNTITTLDITLPTAVDGIGVASIGSNVYLFGGYNGSSYLNTINVFNTETNTITTLDITLPTAAYSIGVASVGTNIYLFGGRGNTGYLSTINVFNTETNSITTLDITLPNIACSIGLAVIGTNIYLFGGYNNRGLSTINVFNTETNTITTLDITLPTAAYSIGVASVGSNVYLFGGGDNNGNKLDTINAFILGLSLPTNNILIESTVGKNYFDILPNFEIGVKNVYRGNDDGIAEKVEAFLYKDGVWTNIWDIY